MKKFITMFVVPVLAGCFSFTLLHNAYAQQDFLFERLPRIDVDVSAFGQNMSFSEATHQLVSLNPFLFAKPLQAELFFATNDNTTYMVVHDREWRHLSGGTTWVGYLKEQGKAFRVFITKAKGGAVSGSIRTPAGTYRLRQGIEGVWLIDEKALGLTPAPFGEDGLSIPAARGTENAAPMMNAEGDEPENSIVDIMVLYTPGLASAYPDEALSARLDELVAISNQAYVDSGINMSLRMVHSEEIGYSETVSNSDALSDLTSGNGVFSGIATLRNTYGADLVSFIRPYYQPTHGSCGVAWLITSIGMDNYGFSVIGDGDDSAGSNYFCNDYSFVHELGHNMGCAHDRAHASTPGYYSYSYGYGFPGYSGTIMSYISPKVPYFSNPDLILCDDGDPSNGNPDPCGFDETDPNFGANNALTLNNTRPGISAFRATVVPVQPTDTDVFFDFGTGPGIYVYYNNTTWTRLHNLSPEIMAMGDLDGNGQDEVIVDFGAPYGIWVHYNNTTWTQLHNLSAEIITTGDLDGNGRDEVIVDFGAPYGIWVLYNNTTWTQLHTLRTEIIATGDLDGNGRDEVVMDFGAPYGIWVLYNNTTWTQLHTLSAEVITTGDLDGNGRDEIVVDFGTPYGIWVHYNNTTWTQLHNLSAEIITTGDLDGNGRDEVIVDFGAPYGIYVYYNNTTWTQLHTLSAEIITTGDLDGNEQDEIVMDFGAPYGIYVYYNNTTWTQLHSLSPELINTGHLDNQ